MARLSPIILLLCIGLKPLAQSSSKVLYVEDADEHFRTNQFVAAIPIYKAELKKDPYNVDLKYRLGVCYINSRLNRQQAITYLEEASRDPGMEAEVWMHLGKAYHLDGRIEDAIGCYEKFARLKPKRADEVEHYLEQCQNAQELMKRPVNVSFQNLGKEINSSEPDYYPFIDKDEMMLVFTTRRKENIGGKKVEADGYRSSDIYQSRMVNGKWTPATNAGRNVNTSLDEQVVGLRADGMEMYVYMDHIETYGDIYICRRKDRESEFSKPKIFDPMVNQEIESSGFMNEDGSFVLFARREKSNEGNSDLYISRLLPNGRWGLPQALPPNINTPYNEDMPYLSYDGKTLYFASQGHNSMGGYDLFRCTWDQENNVFSNPENLGYPVNSPDDERSICVTRDNKLAYVSAYRPTGFGDLDLYRVKFAEEEPVNVIYTGYVTLGDSIPGSAKNYDVKIMVTDVATNFEYIFVPNHSTGKFVMALPAGSYRLFTYCKGYVRHKEEFTVSDMGKVNLERPKNLHLRRLRKSN